MVDIQGATGGEHKLAQWLLHAELPSIGKALFTSEGYLVGWSTTTPNDTTDIGFARGAIFMHTDGAADDQLFVNEGTVTSSTWTAVGSVG